MRIGELSRKTGVSERLLRYYEEQGLLRPRRRPSGYREYAESDVETVRTIRCLLTAGLGTSTIAQVLPCAVGGGGAVGVELVRELVAERERIDRAIGELHSSRQLLQRVIAAGSR
ncbi:MerR family transcriptional regulator [Mangrovactinospora gilvigrisea]|uniref:MerR family transcriptional regulator n=1 Tax=Mangrovactinospora gilvigrisea TaxID=1428644 RepID=A0A1J7BAI9_9ACTN|nr:MerR family transcriptional regulator [Mangrovactinospora gilvigrisea]OIV35675.1 MerR family transcriptional regulator [Mangrovactinospora gilvigrisea]